MGLRDQVAELLAARVVALHHRDGHPGLQQHAREIDRNAAAAHEHGMAHRALIGTAGDEEAAELVGAAGDAEPVARAEDEIAVWDQSLSLALHYADEHAYAELLGQGFERHPVKPAADSHTMLDNFGAALGESVHTHGAGKAQDAGNLLGALIVGIHDDAQPQRLAQKFALIQVFRVAHAGDHMLRAELARRDAADHVHLVQLGRGHQQIRACGPGLAQGLGIGGAALDTDDVQLVGEEIDKLPVAVDDGDVVPLLGQNGSHGAADFPGAGNDNSHGSPPYRSVLCLTLSFYHVRRELYRATLANRRRFGYNQKRQKRTV